MDNLSRHYQSRGMVLFCLLPGSVSTGSLCRWQGFAAFSDAQTHDLQSRRLADMLPAVLRRLSDHRFYKTSWFQSCQASIWKISEEIRFLFSVPFHDVRSICVIWHFFFSIWVFTSSYGHIVKPKCNTEVSSCAYMEKFSAYSLWNYKSNNPFIWSV